MVSFCKKINKIIIIINLFTFSNKVIQFHNSITEHFNVQKKRKQSKKTNIWAAMGYDPHTSGSKRRLTDCAMAAWLQVIDNKISI
jgi:hypothetical protein